MNGPPHLIGLQGFDHGYGEHKAFWGAFFVVKPLTSCFSRRKKHQDPGHALALSCGDQHVLAPSCQSITRCIDSTATDYPADYQAAEYPFEGIPLYLPSPEAGVKQVQRPRTQALRVLRPMHPVDLEFDEGLEAAAEMPCSALTSGQSLGSGSPRARRRI